MLGSNEHGQILHTMDVMDTNTLQWFTAAASLPREIALSSVATACGDTLYILGRELTWMADPARAALRPDTTAVYCCSLQAIVQSCQPSPTGHGAASMLQQTIILNRIRPSSGVGSYLDILWPAHWLRRKSGWRDGWK